MDEVTIDPGANWKAVEKPKDMSDDSEGETLTLLGAWVGEEVEIKRAY